MNHTKPHFFSRVRRCQATRRVRLLAFVLTLVVWMPTMAREWQDATRSQAIDLLEAGACDGFWHLVWPHAKRGQQEAVLLLASAMYSKGLTPPGAGSDVLARLRGLTSVYAEAARSGNPHAVEMLRALLQADVYDEGGGRRHSACLGTATSKGECIEAAIRDGLIPRYGRWSDEIDAIGEGGVTAMCLFLNHDRRLTDDDFDVRPEKSSD